MSMPLAAGVEKGGSVGKVIENQCDSMCFAVVGIPNASQGEKLPKMGMVQSGRLEQSQP